MLLAALLLGAAAVVLTTFWDEIKDWLIKGIKKVKELLRMVVYGSKIFLKKIREAAVEIAKHYSQDNQGKWHETVVTREVTANEVPPEILAKANRNYQQEVDITNELELQLA